MGGFWGSQWYPSRRWFSPWQTQAAQGCDPSVALLRAGKHRLGAPTDAVGLRRGLASNCWTPAYFLYNPARGSMLSTGNILARGQKTYGNGYTDVRLRSSRGPLQGAKSPSDYLAAFRRSELGRGQHETRNRAAGLSFGFHLPWLRVG